VIEVKQPILGDLGSFAQALSSSQVTQAYAYQKIWVATYGACSEFFLEAPTAAHGRSAAGNSTGGQAASPTYAPPTGGVASHYASRE
jgi:hypothetical protein